MGPKYEFTDETLRVNNSFLHRIKRLSDGLLGGFIEKEENLSQDGNCWVGDEACVFEDAQVYGDAQVFGNALVCGNAKVYDKGWIYGKARVWDSVQVYGNAQVSGEAEIENNVKIYGNAQVFGNAEVNCDAEVCGNAKVDYCVYCGVVSNDGVKDFIYKINDSQKLEVQTEYESISEFFSEPAGDDLKLDTLIICTVDTKEPIVKFQKINSDGTTKFKFIVEITNSSGEDFIIRTIIKSSDQLYELIQQTIDSLRNYSQFSKYASDLENCL